jgi:hypothetical protein
MADEVNTWSTSMMYVAAYLRMQGFPLLDIEVNLGGRDYLIFEETAKLVEEANRCFDGSARVEPRRYSSCYGEVRKAMLAARDRARAATAAG